MPARLRAVGETGVCSFCWRTLPLDDLHVTAERLMCNDEEACCDEFRHWDYGARWREHPEYERRAVAV